MADLNCRACFKIRYTVEIMIADQINITYRSLEFRKTLSTFKNRVARVSNHSGRLFGSNSFKYMLPATKASEIFLFVPCRDEDGSSKMLNNNLAGI